MKEVSVILVEGDETLGLACVPCVGLGQPLVGSCCGYDLRLWFSGHWLGHVVAVLEAPCSGFWRWVGPRVYGRRFGGLAVGEQG